MGAGYVRLEGLSSDNLDPNGMLSGLQFPETRTVTMTAYGPGGAHSQNLTITVFPAEPSITDFKADPTVVAYGGSTKLSVTAANAVRIEIAPGSYSSTSGSLEVTIPMTATTTFEATATGRTSNPARKTLTVRVEPKVRVFQNENATSDIMPLEANGPLSSPENWSNQATSMYVYTSDWVILVLMELNLPRANTACWSIKGPSSAASPRLVNFPALAGNFDWNDPSTFGVDFVSQPRPGCPVLN